MTIQQLKVFRAVCDVMNYSKAAEACYISRQALRQNITALENELNGPLFENTSNHISLTELGKKLLVESQDVLEAFDRLTENMNSYIDKRCFIRIGISKSLVPDYIPGLKSFITKYADLHPDIHLETFEMLNDDVAVSVRNGIIDCGFVMDMGMSDKDIVRTEITSHPISVTMQQNTLPSVDGYISVDDLNDKILNLPGEGIEFLPLFEAIEKSSASIEWHITPSYYQAYYNVRELGEFTLNRYIVGSYNHDHQVDTLKLRGLPNICSSAIMSAGSNSAQVSKFISFIKRRVQKENI